MDSLYEDILKLALIDDKEGQIEHWKQNNRNYYYRGTITDIMVRDNRSQNGTVVIARVEFDHINQGNFRKLEDILIKNSAKQIIIESVLTEEMKNVAIHMGYELENDYPYCLNYVKEIC